MTKKELNEIVKLKSEVKQLQEKLKDTVYGNSNNGATDKVKGSQSSFPYTERTFFITGFEEMSEGCINQRNEISKKLSTKYKELLTKTNKALEYIHSIEDSDIRQIFTYKYIDGLTWEQTGEAMNYAAITVRKKHDEYVKKYIT